jgi:hypothetical protein
VPPEWIAVYDGDYDDVLSDEELLAIQIDTVYVLTVCSDEGGSFEERPIQEQMDYITKMVRHGPQWWMGVCIEWRRVRTRYILEFRM